MNYPQTLIETNLIGQELLVSAILPRPGGYAVFEFESDRNRCISKQSDISERNPNAEKERQDYPYDVEMWFPVVDIQVEPGMEAHIELDRAESCRCFFNSFAWQEPYDAAGGTITVAAEHLVHWENGLFIPNRTTQVKKFSLFKKVAVLPTISRKAHCRIRLLSLYWSGNVRVRYEIDGHWETLESIWIQTKEQEKRLSSDQAPQIGVTTLNDSLKESVRFILGTQNECTASPHYGGFYLFYDLDAETYRQGQWPWGWGPSIKLLMEASHVEPTVKEFSRDCLVESGYRAARASLPFQAYHPYHITDGLGTTRYSPRQYDKTGFQELVSAGSDAGFLVGWGWMSAYRETKDKSFLKAAEDFARSVHNVLSVFDLPPQDWLTASGDWIDFTIDESGFGTEGLAELYLETKDPQYAALCAQYMDRHTKYFEREDGLWDRCYHWHSKKTTPTFFNTRGLGWAFEGLLATYRANPDKKIYLQKAVKMAEVLLQGQQEDGSWNYNYTQPIEQVGTSEKGTALYSLLYYNLYGYTGEKRYLEAARKALKWCMSHQYMGNHPHIRGGIIACSPASCVIYRQFYEACCNYTSGFLGLAVLEEMKLA